MRPIYALVLAAGNGERFKSVSSLPKPYIPIDYPGHGTAMMVDHVLNSIPSHMKRCLAVPDMATLYAPMADTIKIRETNSPVDTLRQALEYLPNTDTPILVLDCDTVVHSDDLDRLMSYIITSSYASAVAVTTNTTDRNMSRVDQVPSPVRFVEKEMISCWGIVSARAFDSVRHLRLLLKAWPSNGPLSPLLGAYGNCFAYQLRHRWLDWGTPERLSASGAKVAR